MSFLDKLKKKDKEEPKAEKPEVKVEKKEEKKEEKKAATTLTERKEKHVAKPSKDDTGNAYRILMQPLITEKATALGAENKYAFMVSGNANKQEVKKAIVKVYGVKPIKVNIINVLGKSVSKGRNPGKKKDWKKAIITLKKGETIQIYEGV